mgnify:CR=1 FL=1
MPLDPPGATRAARLARLLVVTLLGFASGLPLALTGQAMQAWLSLAGLDLATLICWGEAALRLHRSGANARQAFVESAADVWVDRIVPLKGADLDPEIERVIAGYVSANAPSNL